MKPKNWLESLNCAIEGILYVAKTQPHMRYHFITAIAVLLLSLFLNLSWMEFSVLCLCITLVLFAEVINTAVEVTIDLISEEFHPLARIAKDVSAGAVLLTVIGSLAIGYVVLSRHIFPPAAETLKEVRHSKADLTLVSLLLVIIAVVITKAKFGKGLPLHGGMPSGHSAIAFSVWTAITLITMGPDDCVNHLRPCGNGEPQPDANGDTYILGSLGRRAFGEPYNIDNISGIWMKEQWPAVT